MQFKNKYMVRTRELGIRNEITNYGILDILEDIAGMHSDSVGYGIKDINKNKKSWIIMNWKLKVFKRPGYGENLLVKTWTRSVGKEKDKYFSYRDFEILDDKGERVAIATSKWILYDIERKRIARINQEIIELYGNEKIQVFLDAEFKKLEEAKEYNNIIEYLVRRSDIDINNHVHNLNYLNIAYEALPLDVYNEKESMNVEIEYKHQIKYGEKVKCYYSKEGIVHIIVVKSEDDNTIHSIIRLF